MGVGLASPMQAQDRPKSVLGSVPCGPSYVVCCRRCFFLRLIVLYQIRSGHTTWYTVPHNRNRAVCVVYSVMFEPFPASQPYTYIYVCVCRP